MRLVKGQISDWDGAPTSSYRDHWTWTRPLRQKTRTKTKILHCRKHLSYRVMTVLSHPYRKHGFLNLATRSWVVPNDTPASEQIILDPVWLTHGVQGDQVPWLFENAREAKSCTLFTHFNTVYFLIHRIE